jgi:hypothetical protein
MSESGQTNVDVPLILRVMTQLDGLSTSMGTMKRVITDGSDLGWTGADNEGTALHEELTPAEKGSIQAVTDAKEAVDGVIHSLGVTAGVWRNTEGANIGLTG